VTGPWIHRWWRADTGSAATEMTIIAPLLVMVMLLVAVVIHRSVNTRLRLDDIAHQAARAASLERTATAAADRARTTATTALAASGVTCDAVTISADTSAFNPGGSVDVQVSCVVNLGDALLLGVPGSRTLTATATEPIDTWRGTSR
jgi:Flp pilus assembly protein TadG